MCFLSNISTRDSTEAYVIYSVYLLTATCNMLNVLPVYICTYCGKPAALSQRHASRASTSVTSQEYNIDITSLNLPLT